MSSQSSKFERLYRSCLYPGLCFVLIALSSNMIGLTHGPVDKARWMLGTIGLVLCCLGLLQTRVLTAYRWIVFTVANTILLLFLLEVAATFVHRVTPAPPAARNSAVGEVHLTSVGPRFYVGWRGNAYAGESVRIDDDGLRATLPKLEESDAPVVRIFTFGGSTMWGEGAADNETIAAWLQQKLNADRAGGTEVTNFGQRAWVSTQSLVELTLQLQHGNIPDVVVFYDGYNETTAAYSTGRIGVPENFEGLLEQNTGGLKSMTRWARRTDLGRLLSPTRRAERPPIDVATMAQDVVNNYAAVHRIVKALGKEYKFDVHFFWQPQLYMDPKTLTSTERAIVAAHPWLPDPVKALSEETYRLARILAAKREGISDVSDAFTGMTEELYLDPCHIVGAGNERVASVMLDTGLLATVTKRRNDGGANSVASNAD